MSSHISLDFFLSLLPETQDTVHTQFDLVPPYPKFELRIREATAFPGVWCFVSLLSQARCSVHTQFDLVTPYPKSEPRIRNAIVLLFCLVSRLFWAQLELATLVPFQGPKNLDFSAPHPPKMPLVMDSPPLKTT